MTKQYGLLALILAYFGFAGNDVMATHAMQTNDLTDDAKVTKTSPPQSAVPKDIPPPPRPTGPEDSE